jgi:TolA-binding protein
VKSQHKLLQFLTILPIFIAIVALTGCSVTRPVGNFFGQRYVNAVSYFNTFYNARRLFDETVAEVETAQSRQRTQNKAGQSELSNPTREKFNKVIEKCSRLLHQYPRSKYADNAVFLIGKSYYYMNQNVQAERKFFELLAEFPESPFVNESLLLLSKTQRRMNKNTEAQVTISDLINRLEGSRQRNLLAEAYLERGNLEKDNGLLSNALSSYYQSADMARSSEIKAQSLFKTAQILELLGRKQDALEVYAEVIEERTEPLLLFDSHLAIVRITSEEGNYEDALEMLHTMLDDLYLSEYASLIEFEAAELYRQHGYLEQAIDQYVYVDTTYVRTDVSTRASFELGSLYELQYGDFTRAKQYYEKSSRGSPPSDVTRKASQKNEIMTRYWKFRNELVRLDSLILVQKDMLADVRAMQSDEVAAPDTITMPESDQAPAAPKPAITDIDALHTIIKAYEEQKIKNLYEIAGLFYIELARPDSSLYWYRKLVREFPGSEYTPQSLYALGELLRIAGEDSALEDELYSGQDSLGTRESVYSKLITLYPETEYAQQAKRILGIQIGEIDRDSSLVLYRIAEDEMLDGDPHRSVDYFSTIVRDFSSSEYAPRAQFAIGWIYENILDLPDSAILHYQNLISTYPSSQYAASVKPRLEAWGADNRESESQTETQILDPEAEIRETESEIQDDRPYRNGIPIVRPTDIRNLEATPDTTRARRNIIDDY